MSGIKRILNPDETNDDTQQLITPNNSPDSKKVRYSSSYSENDEETEVINSENGITDGKMISI